MRHAAVLLIDCPDRKGLVAKVASLLYRYGANIIHADQHQDPDAGLFFMRVEWALDGFDLDSFRAAFDPLARVLEMDWRLSRSSDRPRLAIMASRQLHCLADLLERHRAGELPCDIAVVVSNHGAAAGLARFYEAPFEHTPTEGRSRQEVEAEQLAILRGAAVDLVA